MPGERVSGIAESVIREVIREKDKEIVSRFTEMKKAYENNKQMLASFGITREELEKARDSLNRVVEREVSVKEREEPSLKRPKGGLPKIEGGEQYVLVLYAGEPFVDYAELRIESEFGVIQIEDERFFINDAQPQQIHDALADGFRKILNRVRLQ